tara:strand:+ start:106 stop:822 length:717 start_codon:yes stop_codon:yes gene_type:complete
MPGYTSKQSKTAPTRGNKKGPFCRVCKDAGKCRAEYESHYPKDRETGRTICPTLLSTKCTWCGTKGHTRSHCGAYIEHQKAEHKEAKRLATETDADGFVWNVQSQTRKSGGKKATNKKVVVHSATMFAMLSDNTDSSADIADDKVRRKNSNTRAIAHYNAVGLSKMRSSLVKHWRMVAGSMRAASSRMHAQKAAASCWGKPVATPVPTLHEEKVAPATPKQQKQLPVEPDNWWDSDEE